MSKNSPVKVAQHNLQKVSSPTPAVLVKSANSPAPALRQVSALPALTLDSKNNMLVAYKDLNQVDELQLRNQKHQMAFAFSIFMLLGIFILIGQFIMKPRMVASTDLGFKVEAVPSQVEHYQYDKSCYKGENGEQVCLTRTSQKR